MAALSPESGCTWVDPVCNEVGAAALCSTLNYDDCAEAQALSAGDCTSGWQQLVYDGAGACW